MKILSVRFQNLNSLKGTHEIRFDESPLAEAGLFAITGPTGAGKTTILDAITVGLYGQVHRHSNDKPLELMTRHTAESAAEVEFEANGQRYRSKWAIRRSRGKADGNMQPVHMELYCFSEDTLFDLKPSQVPDKVAEICGLDYSQFLRSVMLSQGDFARFLKASPNERSSLLEKITDTGIYSDISKSAYKKAKDEQQRKEELERRLQDTQLLPEEQRQAYVQSINELTGQEAILQNESRQLQAQVQWLQQVAHLQARQQQHQQALHLQEQKLAQLQPEFRKLQQHEQAHQFVGELADIRSTNGKLTEVQEQLLTLAQRLPALAAELEQAGSAAAEAGKAHLQQQEALQQLEPLLAKVSKLDHQLHTTREAYQKDKTAYVALEEALQQEQLLLQTKQQELDRLTQEATSIKNWLAQNEQLADLKEHLPEFKSTLRDLQETELRLKRNQQEQQELQHQLQQEALQTEALTQAQAQQQARQQQLETQKQEKFAHIQAMLASKSIDELELAAQAQPATLARYARLQELAQQHTLLLQKRQSINTQLQQHEQQLTSTRNTLQQTQAKYTDAAAHLEALQQLVQLQQQIQKYEEVRHTLVQQQPCPLCGATHHPFAENGYTFDLPEEVQKRDRQQALVKELEQSMQALHLQQSALEQKQSIASAASTETETELSRLQHAFAQAAAGVPESISITGSARLAELLQAQQQQADTLQQKLAQTRAWSRQLESINQDLQQLREAQVQAQSKYNQLQQSGRMLQTQLQKLQTILADEQQQQQAHTQTAESFAASFNLKYKPAERQQLLQTLAAQAATFQQQQQALKEMREKYVALNSEVNNRQTNTQQKEQERQKQKQRLKETHAQLTRQKAERQVLFQDKDPEQERQRAQQELRRRTAAAEQARLLQLQKQQELREARTRQTECHTRQQQHTSVLEELKTGLLRVLHQKGIATIEALSQMLLDRDEADRLANLKAQTEKHLTELHKSLSDVQQELAQTQALQLTEASIESLQAQQQQQTEQQRTLIGQRARYQQLLEQDALQQEKNRELAGQLHTQQQVYRRWAQLSELIGSADGNKFSRFAQGLTLARLVELANRHLQKLNERYRILKSQDEDLELLIVDTYQAEAVRPMNTLSGGESFLVSLALALGLSDLAGRRTQINSLFIDEGFGTLDADTLDAAISALENLQAGGKMIGIISHVEALKERIGTQIKVQRLAGGVSTVQVVG